MAILAQFGGCDMSIARADQAEGEAVRTGLGLDGKAACKGRADEIALSNGRALGAADEELVLLVSSEFIFRRQEGMGLGRALDLRDLDEGLIRQPAQRVSLAERRAVIGGQGEHLAIGRIGIVRNGE